MRRPDAVDAARVLALGLLVVAGAGLLVRYAGLPVPFASAIQQAGFLIIPLAYARVAGLSALHDNGYVRIGFRTAALVLVASMGTMWLLQGLVEIQREVFELLKLGKRAAEEQKMLTEMVQQTRERGTLSAVAILAIVPPFCEETFFRGIVLKGLATRFGIVITVIATSVLFAALHPTLLQMVLMVFLGVYFAVLVRLTGSLWSSILAHAVNNLAVILLQALYGSAADDFHAPWWMTLLSGVVFALAITMLALDRKSSTEGDDGGGAMKYSDRR